ncbi:MAG: DNA internalization-related competence protein ComEC/Rec2 [Burkholderiaceae bacterium]
MRAAALVAFVAGVFLLQQRSELPGAFALVLLAAAAAGCWVAACAVARRGSSAHGDAIVAALASAGAACAGFAYAAAVAHVRMGDELAFADEGRDVRVTGVIASLPVRLERGTRFEFAVERAETPGVRIPARIALAWYGADVRVMAAERWSFTVRLRRPHGALNPGGFDVEAWLLERNLRATGYVRDGAAEDAPRRLDPLVWQPGAAIDRARQHLRDAMQRRVANDRYGGVLVALVLGDQRAIAEADWALFNRTGISHLVSISGLHITMIAGLAAVAVGALWRRSRHLLAFGSAQAAAATAAMAAALAYCLLAGWGVPAQRTFFMLAAVAGALVLRRGIGPATTLAQAAAIVCALDPWAVGAPGFWLSFGAVAAIFLVMHGRAALRVEHGWRTRGVDAVRIQLAVTLALIPLTIALFQQVSVVSPLANAVAIPVVSLAVTPLALIGAAFVMLPEPFASFAIALFALAHWLFALLAGALQTLVSLPWSSVPLAAPPPWALFFAVGGVAWLLAPPGWPLRWVGAAWLLPLFVWPAARPAHGELWVTALDVGQGMAVLVETHDAVLLYDTGPRYTPAADAGSRVILPYLRWRGIGRLDALVVSHLDNDHSGGAASIVRALPVARVLTSIDPAHPALAGAARIERCAAGQRIALGALEARVLHPLVADYARPGVTTNALSCVLAVGLDDASVLLTGDLPAREEAQLVARGGVAAVRLASAPHHGSRHSSSEAFVAAARPQWVGVQAGYRNRFGHPDPGVVERYRRIGAKVMRTDHAGAIQWRFRRDGAVQVEAWRLQHARYWHNRPAPAFQPESAEVEEPTAGAAHSDEALPPY